MPEISDLHAAFTQLEQEIPDGYRSPVVEQRLANLQAPVPDIAAPGRRVRVIGAALLAAAAVAAVTVGVTLARGGSDAPAPAGTGPSTSSPPLTSPPQSVSPSAPESSAPASGRPSSVTPTDGLPRDAGSLVQFVSGGSAVSAGSYGKGAAQAGQPMTPTPGVLQFTTPSGNISCGLVGGGSGSAGAGLMCNVAAHTWAAATKPGTCTLNWAGATLTIAAGSPALGACVGGLAFAPVSPVLPYGSTLRDGTVACRSDSGFLACADLATGRGFAVDRTAVRLY